MYQKSIIRVYLNKNPLFIEVMNLGIPYARCRVHRILKLLRANEAKTCRPVLINFARGEMQ